MPLSPKIHSHNFRHFNKSIITVSIPINTNTSLHAHTIPAANKDLLIIKKGKITGKTIKRDKNSEKIAQKNPITKSIERLMEFS